MSLSVRTKVCEPNADTVSKTVCKMIISVSVHAAQWLREWCTVLLGIYIYTGWAWGLRLLYRQMLMNTDANICDYERYWTGMLIPARAGDSWVFRQALRSIVPGSLRHVTACISGPVYTTKLIVNTAISMVFTHSTFSTESGSIVYTWTMGTLFKVTEGGVLIAYSHHRLPCPWWRGERRQVGRCMLWGNLLRDVGRKGWWCQIDLTIEWECTSSEGRNELGYRNEEEIEIEEKTWIACNDLLKTLDKTLVIPCWVLMKGNANMSNDFSDVSWCLFALFVLKSSHRFLQFSSIRKCSLHLTQIGIQHMQKKQLCLYVAVWSPSLIAEAIK